MTALRPRDPGVESGLTIGLAADDPARQRIFACWRGPAGFRAKRTANEGSERNPTDRGQDKSAQCVRRSVDCFCFRFLPIQQCAAPPRNVRRTVNALAALHFSHIAGIDDG
jgi:hypothetical protein